MSSPHFRSRVFSLGEVVSNRFRIDRFIGDGGMGEVYAARDLELGGAIAIKTIRFNIAADPGILARFKQEIQLSRRITHPNVCRIFDIARHTTPDGIEVTYLTMELLPGQTLSEHLAQSGKMTAEQAASVVLQMAQGLGAAHAAGVVHRDFKPSNVILTPAGDGVRAVITDFGLAQVAALSADDSTGVVTAPGRTVGTLAYMPPEQIEGSPVTAASDIYALGLVMFEMLTGRQPFRGKSVLSAAASRLHEEPPSPRTYAPELPPNWENAILRCLDREPERRYVNTHELIQELRGESVSAPVSTTGTRAIVSRRETWKAGIVAAALLAVCPAAWFLWSGHKRSESPEAERWLDTGTNAIRDLTYFKATKALDQAVQIDNRLTLAHARLAEAWFELDSIEKAKEEVLRATAPGSRTGSLDKTQKLYLEAVQLTVTRDFAGALSRYREIARSAPDGDKVFGLVDLGRASEKAGQPDEARRSYLEATRLAPQFPAAHLRLAVFYARQRDASKAAAEFAHAESLYQAASNLEGSAEVNFQRGRFAISRRQFAEARADLEKALSAATATGNPHQRIETLLQMSIAVYDDGKLANAQQYAQEAIDLARANGIENLAAGGLINFGTALFLGGDYQQAESYYHDALNAAVRSHADQQQASALFNLGSLLASEGKNEQAVADLEKSLEYYRRNAFLSEVARASILIGRARRNQGDLAGALQIFHDQLQAGEKAGDRPLMALAHESMGSILLRQEDFPGSLEHYRQNYLISKQMGSAQSIGYSAVAYSDLLWHLGDYRTAADISQEFLSPDNSNVALRAQAYANQAQMFLSQNRFSDAATQARKSLELTSPRNSVILSECKRTLGLALVRSGSYVEGKNLCEEALALSANMDVWYTSRARLAVAEAMLASGEVRAAQAALAELEPQFAKAEQNDSRWRALVLAARASVALRDSSAARKSAGQALNLLSGFENAWGKQAYDGYLSRPDISKERQLAQSLSR
jgi:tetratricopeptide (TPR) repeat protein